MAVKRIYKRLAILLAVLVMSAGLCINLAACGGVSQEDEQMITAELDKAFETLKNPTQATVNELFGNDASKLEEFSKYGIDPIEMLRHAFGHLDYKVDGIKAEGDKATVKVTLNNVDFQAVASQFASDMQFEKLYTALDESDTQVTTTSELQLEKQNGKWGLTEEGDKELAEIVSNAIDYSSLL